MKRDADIAIVGGGLAGACMANLLVRLEVVDAPRIVLIEPRLPDVAAGKAAPRDFDLRVSALSRASERILRRCGVWESLSSARVGAYERMCVWDEQGSADGAGAIHFDCADIGQPDLGHIAENAQIQRALLEHARQAGVNMVAGQVAALSPADTAMSVELQDGAGLRVGLVIAADGADSPTRHMMGIAATEAGYRQRAIVTHVRTAASHRRTAWQRFLSGGPIALLPIPDGEGERRCSIVWSTGEEAARELMAMDEAEFCQAVEQATDGVLGRVESCVRRADFPLRRVHAQRYIASRFALIGDAAHTVHPLAGQGVNLGFLDAAALAQVLGDAMTGSADVGELPALRRYERWRRGENLLMLTALDGFNRLFSNSSAPLGLLRRAGLTMLNRLGPVKNQFVRRALGLAGELPAAARQ